MVLGLKRLWLWLPGSQAIILGSRLPPQAMWLLASVQQHPDTSRYQRGDRLAALWDAMEAPMAGKERALGTPLHRFLTFSQREKLHLMYC